MGKKLSRRAWTTEELAVLKLYYRDNSNRDICDMLPGRSQRTVKKKAWELGLRKSSGYLRSHCKEMSVLSRKAKRLKFPNVEKAKQDWREITRRHEAGETFYKLAAEYGVGKTTIIHIIRFDKTPHRKKLEGIRGNQREIPQNK